MTIRRMTEKDCNAVGKLYAASWTEGYKGLLPQGLLDLVEPDKFEEHFHNNGFLTDGSFVVTDDGNIVAHCHARAANEPGMRGWGEIHTLYVHPEYWGYGYGTSLLQHAQKWLFDSGFDDFFLYVLENNTHSSNFYRANGFSPNLDTLCCDIADYIVTFNRFTKHSPRYRTYGDEEIAIVESGAAAIAEALKNGDQKRRIGVLFCLDWFLDPVYGKILPQRERVYDVLLEYERTANDSTLFDVRNLLENYF